MTGPNALYKNCRMIKTILFASILALAAVSSASADENYYVCMNQDAASKQPASVLVMATSQGMIGLFNAANVNPPRALFNSAPVAVSLIHKPGETTLAFGAVSWQGKHDGFNDFQTAEADFDSAGRMVRASFNFSADITVYGACVIDGDN